MIEVQRMLVHGHQREPGIVGFADRAAGTVLVDVAHVKVLEIAPEALAITLRADLFEGLRHLDSPATAAWPSTSSVCSPSAGSRNTGRAGSSRKRIGGPTWVRPRSSRAIQP